MRITHSETLTSDERLRGRLWTRLSDARSRTDDLFTRIRSDAIFDRPIPERHRFIFYLGHLEAFDWNMVCRNAFGMDSMNADFDRLFAFGIDPTNGNLPDDKKSDWPSTAEIMRYNSSVRRIVDRCLTQASFQSDTRPYLTDGFIFNVAIEHRLMHAETLAYMLHNLPYALKQSGPAPTFSGEAPPVPERVHIPAGWATLGLESSRNTFGWDNEFQTNCVFVPEFAMDVYNVTNAQYLEFIRAGGYEDKALWTSDAWNWIRSSGQHAPKFWRKDGERWWYRGMFAEIPLPAASPVYVSHAEAAAYARWSGQALPTEAQYHRAAFGTVDGPERQYPWGDEKPQAQHGNFDSRQWDPSQVDAHPAGTSAFGVADLMSNGWEWTSTIFGPFPEFQPFPFYPGYSADFFDGKHFVMKGASPRTALDLLRRSFRNWFQPFYPHIYATFRCVQS